MKQRSTLIEDRRAEDERINLRLSGLGIDPQQVENLRRSVFSEISFRHMKLRSEEKAELVRLARLAFNAAIFDSDSPPNWVEAARKAGGL